MEEGMYSSKQHWAETDEKTANAPSLPDKNDLGFGAQSNIMFPPPYSTEKGALEVESDMLGKNYWTGEMTSPGFVDCEGKHPSNERAGLKKKSRGKCIMGLTCLVMLGLLLYMVGRRSGFWRGYHHGMHHSERGCRDGKGQWRGGEGDGHGRYQGRSCNYRRQGRDEERRSDYCIRDTQVEWDDYVHGEEGSRLVLRVWQDEQGQSNGYQILEYFDENGQQICMYIEGELRDQGDWADSFDQFRDDILNRVPFGNGTLLDFANDQIEKVSMVAVRVEEILREEILAKSDGICEDSAEIYQLTEQASDEFNDCMRYDEFAMPYGYQPQRYHEGDQPPLDFKLFMFCIRGAME